MVLAGNSLKRFSLLHTHLLSYIKETLIPHYAPPNNIHKAAPNSTSSLPYLPTPLRDVFPDPPDAGTADQFWGATSWFQIIVDRPELLFDLSASLGLVN